MIKLKYIVNIPFADHNKKVHYTGAIVELPEDFAVCAIRDGWVTPEGDRPSDKAKMGRINKPKDSE